MGVAGGGPSVHACAVFLRAESRDGDKLGQTPYGAVTRVERGGGVVECASALCVGMLANNFISFFIAHSAPWRLAAAARARPSAHAHTTATLTPRPRSASSRGRAASRDGAEEGEGMAALELEVLQI